MKKIEYKAPEMEVIKMKAKMAILAGSETATFDDPEEL